MSSEMDRKYKLTDEKKVLDDGTVLYRIQALRDFNLVNGKEVKVGDLGGWVESESNLSHDGESWIGDEAMVRGNAKVGKSALVFENANIYDSAHVKDRAQVYGDASVYGNACVFEGAKVYVSVSDNDKRKPKYDLIAVEKIPENGIILVNMEHIAIAIIQPVYTFKCKVFNIFIFTNYPCIICINCNIY